MDEQILSKVRELVEPTYKKVKIWTHGWAHVKHVVEYSKRLAEMEGDDPVLCQVAAYCHDLGRLEEEEKGEGGLDSVHHSELSTEPTKRVLKEVGIGGEDFEKVVEAVRVHSMKKYEGENKVALILQDADRKDALGKFGTLRLFKWDLKLPVEEPSGRKDLDETVGYWLEEAKGKMKPELIAILKWALELYEDLINTESAKEYLLEDYLFTKRLLEEVESE